MPRMNQSIKVKTMIKFFNKLSLLTLLALPLVQIPAYGAANIESAIQTQIARDQTQPVSAIRQQGKMSLPDVPEIAERVNDVVVNVRSVSAMGESLGSG